MSNTIVNNETLLSAVVKKAVTRYLEECGVLPLNDLHDMVISEVEKPLYETVMQYTHFNQTEASKILGVNRGTLRKKLKKYELIGRPTTPLIP